MNVVTTLIVSTVALAMSTMLTVVMVVLWLKAEYKVFRLGGKSWAFKSKKDKDGK